jgi:hypothetical protein
MPRQTFWSDEARDFLLECGRQDLVDSGDALAQRVAALVLTALARLEQYAKAGNLYTGRGGVDLLSNPEALAHFDEFVNKRLRAEIVVLEQLLATFDDLRERQDSAPVSEARDILPGWY